MNIKVLTVHDSIPQADKGDQEENRRLTIEAMADVQSGLVIDHQAVQNWADSLSSVSSF